MPGVGLCVTRDKRRNRRSGDRFECRMFASGTPPRRRFQEKRARRRGVFQGPDLGAGETRGYRSSQCSGSELYDWRLIRWLLRNMTIRDATGWLL
jgi:hypothetical protein